MIWTKIKDFFVSIWNAISKIFNFWVSFLVGLVVLLFDKMGIDQGILREYNDFWSAVIDITNTQVDMFMNSQKSYVKTRIEAIKYFNQNAQLMMDNYAKLLSQFNKKFETK